MTPGKTVVMPHAKHDQRLNVLKTARNAGWKTDSAVFDDGNIIRDIFTSELGSLRAVWLRTPWSLSGRWAGSIFSDRRTGQDRNVWKVTGTGGVLELLSSAPVPDPEA